MSFSRELQKMIDQAKQSYTWELANAGNNLQWNIHALRTHKGWSQHELARQMGVAQSWVARHVAGYPITLDSLAKYAHVFGVSCADMIGEPLHFTPYRLIDDSGEIIGSYDTTSTAGTKTVEVVL